MGMYKYIKQTLQKEYATRSPEYRARLTAWGKQPAVIRVEKPTNLARARELGYRARQGLFVVRARIGRGSRKRKKPDLGRKAGKSGQFFTPGKSLQWIAEERSNKHYPNCEVLGSYWVGATGQDKYFEVILYDRMHGSNKELPQQVGRVFRGLTAAGKKRRAV
ncbi:50S ribosomal protein L15e [Candidatus Burarchaeum australiense]|nr:50S ribosomal protein L15e [Candidatus Burarchaeum australiense]